MLFIIYLILTPILCLLGMLMLEHLERKIKTALAKKAKAVSVCRHAETSRFSTGGFCYIFIIPKAFATELIRIIAANTGHRYVKRSVTKTGKSI